MTNKIVTLEIPKEIIERIGVIAENTYENPNEVLCEIIEDGLLLKESALRIEDLLK